MTTLSIDTGDLDILSEYAATGFITDATTNPVFVSQAAFNGDARYVGFVDEAVTYARNKGVMGEAETVDLAMDRLAVNLGAEISKLIPGYVSTEVDIRESFDTEETIRRALRIVAMYEDDYGVTRDRILVKIAATWEGIKAAEILERDHGISCNLTLVFGFAQAVACAQANVRLISPFPGRILDWHKLNKGYVVEGSNPGDDPGVVAVKRMYAYYKKHRHEKTICMPASWRPSRGAGFETDEIVALAGVDRMTIPPPLLAQLAETSDPLPRILDETTALEICEEEQPIDGGAMTEKTFRMHMTEDVCATAKLAEGMSAFVAETMKLREFFEAHLAQ